MNTVLLIAHAPLAHALREAALHVFADAADDLLAVDVQPDATPEQSLIAARAALTRRAPTGGVLILADVMGATPCNIAARLLPDGQARLVAGVNLPMLLRALTYRHEPLEMLVQRALIGGTQGVLAVDPTGTPPTRAPLPHP